MCNRWFVAAALAAAASTPARSAEPIAQPTAPAVRAEPVVDRTGRYPGPRSAPVLAAPEASRVFIDPKTRDIVEPPADAEPLHSAKSANYVDYTIRASEDGYLFIDTSNHLEVSRARIGADGEIEYACGLDHDHAEDAR